MDDEGPKWRLEHASNNKATCQQAACKRSQIKIATGELRIGTHTLFNNDVEQRWYMAWRHWGCATKHQIAGLKEITGNKPEEAPGFEALSAESQEHVRLAFEAGKPVDKEFKGVREDLAKSAPHYVHEYRDAEGYKVDVAVRAASCRGADCSKKGMKITKGHLRLGTLVNFEDHSSWVYKHWKCISTYDLEHVKERVDDNDGELDGFSTLPMQFQEVVQETLTTGQVVEPPEPEVTIAKSLKSRKKKDLLNDEEARDEEECRVQRNRKKRLADDTDGEEEKHVQKKTRTRGTRADVKVEGFV